MITDQAQYLKFLIYITFIIPKIILLKISLQQHVFSIKIVPSPIFTVGGLSIKKISDTFFFTLQCSSYIIKTVDYLHDQAQYVYNIKVYRGSLIKTDFCSEKKKPC